MKKRKLKILFPFAGNSVGGSHISALTLIRTLRNFSVEPVIAVHYKGKLSEWLDEKEEKYHILGLPYSQTNRSFLINIQRLIRGIPKAGKFLKSHNIDIIHCNDGAMQRSWPIWGKFSNLPTIWHQRNKWQNEIPKETSLALKFASGLIGISGFSDKFIPVFSGPHRLIYNPVSIQSRDKQKCSEKLRQELKVNENTKIIACFANSQAWKRPDTFIETAEIFRKKYNINALFIWFGNDLDGMLEKLLESADYPSNIMRAPFKADVLSAIAGCDTILALSESEPFGRTLVEAMSLKIPVVASRAGGHLEIIKDDENGLFFPVGNAEACAELINKLLSDKKLKDRLIENGVKTAEKFNPEKHASEVLDFYKTVMGCSAE